MSFLEYLADNAGDLIGLTLEHILVVGIAVVIATVIGVTLGVLSYRNARFRSAALGVTGVFLTLPSFALFVIFIGPFGLGFPPAVIALVMYGLLPIVRNTITGLREVDPAIVESARGMGMSRWNQLFRIELPLAWPVIVTGVRVSTVILVGIAAIAAIVNGPGLGDPIFAGLTRIGSPVALDLVLSGMVGVILVAIIFDAFFALIIRFTTPRGLRD